ncbi:hypothetical protein BCR34DRAFT_103614 [Clohesyomyces aquaticus]|uniref:Uncharacterized protein n=1 Tax=Clohesyomyces aquaticus TaxID=1231657 RepID=A0A1Y2A1G6_9PLEO|nr:hypothetical protein BCR34DRAFT_103614 [Clohesyomyces aquaticus]
MISRIYSERSDEDRQKDEQKMKDCQKENDPTDSPGKNGHGDNDEELQAVSDSQNARDEMREPSNERTETRPTQRPTGDNFEDIRELLRHMSTDDRISWVRAQITDLKCRCDLDCRCRNVTHRRTSSSNGSGNTEEGTAPSTSLLMLHNLTRGRLSHEFLHTGGPFEDYRPTAHRPPSIVSLRTSRAPTLLGSDGLTVASSAPRLSIRGLAAAQRGRSRSASRLRQNVSQDDISNAESRRTSSTGARVRVLAGAREENGNHTSPAGSRQASDNASTASGQQNEERAPSTASTHHLNGYRTSDERNRDSPSPPLQGPST